jgi:hypothetical protein
VLAQTDIATKTTSSLLWQSFDALSLLHRKSFGAVSQVKLGDVLPL